MTAQLFGVISLAMNLLLGGGLLAVILRYKVQVRVEDRSDFSLVLEKMEMQRTEALQKVKEQDEKIEMLEAEINGLRIARDLDPFPNWVVDLRGCYRFVNREFETYFLEPRKQTYRDIIGKSHSDIWPEDFCRTIKALDAASRQRPDGTAKATARIDIPNFGLCTVTVHKFPVRFKGAIVAMAGYITSIEPEQQRVG